MYEFRLSGGLTLPLSTWAASTLDRRVCRRAAPIRGGYVWPMFSAPGMLIYLVIAVLVAFALFWVIRLGVRFGMRDHTKWITAGTAPKPE